MSLCYSILPFVHVECLLLWSEKHAHGRKVLPKEVGKSSCPGRRRSLGSLLTKDPAAKCQMRSRGPKKSSLGTEGVASLAQPDALDRCLARTDRFQNESSFLKESPLKR